MQQFEVEGAMDLQTTEGQQSIVFPVRAEGRYSRPSNPWPRIPETEERNMAGVQKKSLSTKDKVQVCAGTSMVSPLQQLLQRHTLRVSK